MTPVATKTPMTPDPATPRIVAFTCLRDDGSYILEWVAHHLACGFDHFVIFTHDCTDRSPDLLDALSAAGIVTHAPFQHTQKVTAQWQALRLAAEHPAILAAEWVLFFDCDEFLWLPETCPGLDQLIRMFGDRSGLFDALAIPWRFFGSGGIASREAGLTPARFLSAAPADLHFPLGHLFKSLFRPARFEKLGVHRPKHGDGRDGPIWLGPDGARLPVGFTRQQAQISLYGTACGPELIGLNHYSLRSLDEFLVKQRRGLPNHMNKPIGLDYWVERNWNTVHEPRILPMLDATRDRLADLLALRDVRMLHEQCLSDYEARLADANAEIDTLRLGWQIGLLAENTPPSAQAAARYIRNQIRARSDPT